MSKATESNKSTTIVYFGRRQMRLELARNVQKLIERLCNQLQAPHYIN